MNREHEGDSSRLMRDLRAKRREQEKQMQEQRQPDLINQAPNQTVINSNTPAPNELLAQEIRINTNKGIEGEIFSLNAMYPGMRENEHPLIAMKATSDPDTMHMHQAMKQPDKIEC